MTMNILLILLVKYAHFRISANYLALKISNLGLFDFSFFLIDLSQI